MKTLDLKPTHKPIKDYYEGLKNLSGLGAHHEGAVSPAFAKLLNYCAHQFGYTLIEKQALKLEKAIIFVDGSIVDTFNLSHGFWEAKDSDDDLEKEISRKFKAGYPKKNMLFQAPERIVIYQDNQKVFDQNITNPDKLVDALKVFFQYEAPAIEEWGKAVEEFKHKVRELANVILDLIEKERENNKAFIQAFEDFLDLCRQTINPNISIPAVEEMLIQHLLTERIFREVFNNPDFVERNAVAAEIEKVIVALTSPYFSRNEFLKPLDVFYGAIETTAATIDDFSQKQNFLNTVYEKFFQGFSIKVADTHGIVYTPQPIVKFMVKSVEHILQKEFGRSLSDNGVHIIDPFVGTGNYILHIMREIPHMKLDSKYTSELHCNEVMLLPYYIASMNIEHAYYEVTGMYKPFEGICLVDTFDLYKIKQLSLMTKVNTTRVTNQQKTPIFIVIGNPPYNAGQVNENDNNKNRKYEEMDKRVSNTYGSNSKATLLRKLNDPYVKAIRWASDRIGDEGIVALVTNNSFIRENTFDGMRKCLSQDFSDIYILDLGGNVRKNPSLSGTTHNVFGIQVGVSINFFIKNKKTIGDKASIHYYSTDPLWRKESKYDFLEKNNKLYSIPWKKLTPDSKHYWLTEGFDVSFDNLIPLGNKEEKSQKSLTPSTIFKTYSLGVNTARDDWTYDFRQDSLTTKIQRMIHNYNSEVARFIQDDPSSSIDDFVNNNLSFVKWTDRLKKALQKHKTLTFSSSNIRASLYRPFTKQYLYFDDLLNQRRYLQHKFFPVIDSELENIMICVNQSSEKSFTCLVSNIIPNYVMCGGFGAVTQCFPLFTYDITGKNKKENITDWVLGKYITQYGDTDITKLDIFNYVYSVLHHPQYRIKYSTNLKHELPRIPFATDFWSFSKSGKKLIDLHIGYEKQPEYKFTIIEDIEAKVNYRVNRMILSKDKSQIIYNEFLTLTGIPEEVFEYKLGNRSALEWVIDQYQIKTDPRSGITNNPNDPDHPQYILQLIGKVITASQKTIQIVKSLPDLY